VLEYAARLRRGEALYSPADAKADGYADRGLAIVVERNGAGPRVVGWEGDEPGDVIRRPRG
jgi:hypothetical protein